MILCKSMTGNSQDCCMVTYGPTCVFPETKAKAYVNYLHSKSILLYLATPIIAIFQPSISFTFASLMFAH